MEVEDDGNLIVEPLKNDLFVKNLMENEGTMQENNFSAMGKPPVASINGNANVQNNSSVCDLETNCMEVDELMDDVEASCIDISEATMEEALANETEQEHMELDAESQNDMMVEENVNDIVETKVVQTSYSQVSDDIFLTSDDSNATPSQTFNKKQEEEEEQIVNDKIETNGIIDDALLEPKLTLQVEEITLENDELENQCNEESVVSIVELADGDQIAVADNTIETEENCGKSFNIIEISSKYEGIVAEEINHGENLDKLEAVLNEISAETAIIEEVDEEQSIIEQNNQKENIFLDQAIEVSQTKESSERETNNEKTTTEEEEEKMQQEEVADKEPMEDVINISDELEKSQAEECQTEADLKCSKNIDEEHKEIEKEQSEEIAAEKDVENKEAEEKTNGDVEENEKVLEETKEIEVIKATEEELKEVEKESNTDIGTEQDNIDDECVIIECEREIVEIMDDDSNDKIEKVEEKIEKIDEVKGNVESKETKEQQQIVEKVAEKQQLTIIEIDDDEDEVAQQQTNMETVADKTLTEETITENTEKQVEETVASEPVEKPAHGKKDCINHLCKHTSVEYFQAPKFALNAFKVMKRKKVQYICSECYEISVQKYEEYAAQLMQGKHLYDSQQDENEADCVEIIDSSDEEDDTKENEDDNESPLASGVLELIESDLESCLINVFKKVNIQQQLSWCKRSLTERTIALTRTNAAIQRELGSMQSNTDRIQQTLNQLPKQNIHMLPPINLNDTNTSMVWLTAFL